MFEMIVVGSSVVYRFNRVTGEAWRLMMDGNRWWWESVQETGAEKEPSHGVGTPHQV